MHCLQLTTPPPPPSKQKFEIAEFTESSLLIGIVGRGGGGWTQDNNFWELFWDHGLKEMAK